MKQHKWAKEIHAWADGAEIEEKLIIATSKTWKITHNPEWNHEKLDFRIKPQTKEPQYLFAYRTNEGIKFSETYYGYTEDVFLGAIELKELLHETT